MTDNEIIKAFKDFLIEQVDGYTDHVETGGERYEFIEKELELLKETDNLINHLQAQLFKERNKNSKLRNERNHLKSEIERLNKEVDRLSQCVLYHDGQIAEAYKEFAEIVKKIDFYQYIEEYYENAELCYEFRQDWVNEKIDNLLKEMEREQ